jgi:carboxymethylenebutenolidase
MCVDHDSRPPISPIAGAAVDGVALELSAADGNRFAAYRADASSPSGAGMIVVPDVRGLAPFYEELALRFAEAGVDAIAIDPYGRTAGAQRREEGFDHAPHATQTTWAGLRADAITAGEHLREARGARSLFSIGFCMGGRISFILASVPELALSGAIGFYGWPVGPRRDDSPAPIDVAPSMTAPVLGIFGGDDQGIPSEQVSAFRSALEKADVDHRIMVMQGAPHSFFDRKQDTFAAASREAWDAVRAFVREHSKSAATTAAHDDGQPPP